MAKRILLVDDEPLILKGLRYTLEQEGYEILTAADGEEALKVFENREYIKASEMMKKLLDKNPRDSVARYYVSLIDNYFAKGLYPTEKDDAGVAFEEEEFVFKLLQK